MYRLLIVDDEPIIVDGIYDLFREVTNPEIDAYRAHSAEEALDWMNRIKVDVMLTDIRMPGMNGLELQKEIKGQWPHCKVIFLTGFNDFEYAQRALRDGSFNYILKTEGDEEIVSSVKKAVEELNKEQSNIRFVQKAREQLQRAVPALQKEYLLSLCEGSRSCKTLNSELLQDLNIPLQLHMPVMLILGRVDCWEERGSLYDKSLLLYAVHNIGQELFSSYIFQPLTIDDSRFIWFLQPRSVIGLSEGEQGAWEKAVRFFQGTLETVQTTSRDLLKLPLSFAVGSGPTGWEHLDECYEELRKLFGRGLGLAKEILLVEDRSRDEYSHSVFEQQNALRTVFKKMANVNLYLEGGNQEQFRKLLEQAKDLLPVSGGDVNLFLEMYYSLAVQLLSQINKWGIRDTPPGISPEKLFQLHLHDSQWDAMDYLQRVSAALFEIRENEVDERSNQVVCRVNQFIESHLDQDLSLTTLSEVVYLNANYLSRLYKQITGLGISEHIAQRRICKAKEYLEQPVLKIHEISKKLGFHSPAYFARLFKKTTGMTPQEYRDSSNK